MTEGYLYANPVIQYCFPAKKQNGGRLMQTRNLRKNGPMSWLFSGTIVGSISAAWSL